MVDKGKVNLEGEYLVKVTPENLAAVVGLLSPDEAVALTDKIEGVINEIKAKRFTDSLDGSQPEPASRDNGFAARVSDINSIAEDQLTGLEAVAGLSYRALSSKTVTESAIQDAKKALSLIINTSQELRNEIDCFAEDMTCNFAN